MSFFKSIGRELEVFVTKTVPKASKTVGREMGVFVTKTIPKAGKAVGDTIGNILPDPVGVEKVVPELTSLREEVARKKTAYAHMCQSYLSSLDELEGVTNRYMEVLGRFDDTASKLGAPDVMDVPDFKLPKHDGVMKVLDKTARVGRSILGAVTFGVTELGFGLEDAKAEMAHLEASSAAISQMISKLRSEQNEMFVESKRMKAEIAEMEKTLTEKGLDTSVGDSALVVHEAANSARIDMAEAMIDQGWDNAFILESTQIAADLLAKLRAQATEKGQTNG
ncbi:MAG: hypothetical protein AAFR93_07630 [Pseudomonadota bacterium]